jgi:hypothetical protein
MKKSKVEIDWNELALKPLILGLVFGTGCYVAKFILNSPLMNGVMNMAQKEVMSKQVA